MFHRESNETPTGHRLCTRSTDHCSPMFLRLFLRPKYPETFLFEGTSFCPLHAGLIVSIIRRSFRRTTFHHVRPFFPTQYSYSTVFPWSDRKTLYATHTQDFYDSSRKRHPSTGLENRVERDRERNERLDVRSIQIRSERSVAPFDEGEGR